MSTRVVKKKPSWKLIGQISVDSGHVQLGDPCYSVEEDKWDAFLVKTGLLDNLGKGYTKVPHGSVSPAKFVASIIVQSGHGDGVYPVYVKEKDGVVEELLIRFEYQYPKKP